MRVEELGSDIIGWHSGRWGFILGYPFTARLMKVCRMGKLGWIWKEGIRVFNERLGRILVIKPESGCMIGFDFGEVEGHISDCLSQRSISLLPCRLSRLSFRVPLGLIQG